MLRIVEVVTQRIQAAKKVLLIKSKTEHKKNAHIIHDGVSWAALYWDEKEKNYPCKAHIIHNLQCIWTEGGLP